jgi:hypothetical protein
MKGRQPVSSIPPDPQQSEQKAPLSINESGQEERQKIVVQVDRIFAHVGSAKQTHNIL